MAETTTNITPPSRRKVKRIVPVSMSFHRYYAQMTGQPDTKNDRFTTFLLKPSIVFSYPVPAYKGMPVSEFTTTGFDRDGTPLE